jgi:hypothetical protein
MAVAPIFFMEERYNLTDFSAYTAGRYGHL